MCRSLIVLVLVLGLASTGFADILLGNFEGGMSDNFVAAWEDSPSLNASGVGATLGTGSLAVKTTGGYWTLEYGFPSVISMGTDVTGFQMDVTFLAEDSRWASGWGGQIDKIAVNSDGASGWKEYARTTCKDQIGNDVGPGWSPGWGDQTWTYSYDMSDSSYNSNGATYLQIIMSVQTGSIPSGIFYIDNVKLLDDNANLDLTGIGNQMTSIPEPATMALLGLGGLALIRRKK
ncbi:MAG: PEP-CTERM sorting domain-containing protein [Sedimentisphaerales bacterium]|jgi:hypothetical protein